MFIKQLLLCFWAYASCHVTCVQLTMNCEPLQASALFSLYGEFAVILIPTAALSPPFWALGWPPQLDHLSSDFEISHGLTLTLSAPSKFETTSLDSTSEGLLWLGTLSIHKGMSNSFSTLKMTLIISSLSSLAVFFLLAAASVCPGRSALQSAEQRCQRRYGHKHQMMSYIIKTLQNMQQGHKNSKQNHPQDLGRQKPRSKTVCTRRGLWWNPKGKHLRQSGKRCR